MKSSKRTMRRGQRRWRVPKTAHALHATCSFTRAIAFFKLRIGWHGLGVIAMAVSLTDSHGHPEDGKSVAPQFEKGGGPVHSRAAIEVSPITTDNPMVTSRNISPPHGTQPRKNINVTS